MPEGRRRIQVQDELELTRACEVAWGMTTDAEIELDGARALLRQDGVSLRATIQSPAGAAFSVESAEREPPDRKNRGVRRLMIRHSAEAGALRITVLLEPIAGEDSPASKAPSVKPLADW